MMKVEKKNPRQENDDQKLSNFFPKNHPSHYDPGTGEETKIFFLYFPSFFFLAALFSVTNEAKLRLPLPPLALITCTVHQGFIKSKPLN